MKIIDNKVTPEFPQILTCEKCKSVMEIESSDVFDHKITGYDPRDGEPYSYKIRAWKCACCDTINEYTKP